jgi:hypothetical protein
MVRKIKNKKAQVWLSDYTISMLLFALAALIAIKIIINSFSATTDFQELKSESAKLSEILLSEGFPANWDNGTSIDIIRPGLLTNKRLNETKVALAMNSSYIDYTSLKFMLQTKHDFAVAFEEQNGSLIKFNDSLCVIGSASVSPSPVCPPVNLNFHYHNLVKLDRLVIYNSSIKRMVVYVWN